MRSCKPGLFVPCIRGYLHKQVSLAFLPKRAFPAQRALSSSSTTKTSSSSAIKAEYAERMEDNNRKNREKPVKLKGVKHNGSTKRFYDQVGIEEIEENEFAITIGGRLIETVVTKSILSVPTHTLASMLAFEWDSQLEFVKPHSMPLTNLTTIALDQIPTHRANMVDSMMKYCDYDSACLRDFECNSLVRLQSKHWDPVIGWMKKRFGVVMEVTQPGDSPIAAVKQTDDTRKVIRAILEGMTDWELAVMDAVSSVSRSLSVSLAVMYGQLDVNRAYECCRLEENYQMRKYGRVDGLFGHGIDIEYTKMRLGAARTFLNFGGLLVDHSKLKSHPPS